VTAASLLHPLLALVLAPLLPGIANRVKARVAGRTGAPLLQTYYDLARLLRRGAGYSRTTTWVFRAGPTLSLAAVLVALLIVPLGRWKAPLAFDGDFVLFAYLLALARFFTVSAALDTGSAFEGMGASREVQFSALAEPALLVGMGAVAAGTGGLSLSAMLAGPSATAWSATGPALALVAAALAAVFLCENARIPFDDPNTHLELTMIHEVMVLDHGGPDLAFVEYAASLKLWVLGAVVVGVLLPSFGASDVLDALAAAAALPVLAAGTGLVESVTSRLRLVRVPQVLAGAGALSLLAWLLVRR